MGYGKGKFTEICTHVQNMLGYHQKKFRSIGPAATEKQKNSSGVPSFFGTPCTNVVCAHCVSHVRSKKFLAVIPREVEYPSLYIAVRWRGKLSTIEDNTVKPTISPPPPQ